MALRKIPGQTPSPSDPPTEPTFLVNGVAMTLAQIQALAEQASKAPQASAPWYGAYVLKPKGTLKKPYGDKPAEPSPKGWVQFHTVPTVPANALPKGPSSVLVLACLLVDAAQDIIERAGDFAFEPVVVEHWAEIKARLGL